MEVLFGMPEANVSIKKEWIDHGYDVYPVRTLNGKPFHYVESGEDGHDSDNQLFVGFWDKEDPNMTTGQPDQSFMVFYTGQSGTILMAPVNDQEHMEKLLERIHIKGELGRIEIGE